METMQHQGGNGTDSAGSEGGLTVGQWRDSWAGGILGYSHGSLKCCVRRGERPELVCTPDAHGVQGYGLGGRRDSGVSEDNCYGDQEEALHGSHGDR